MTTIVTRAGKGSPLTHNEVDANFNNLNDDKLEKSNNLSDVANVSAARTNLGLGSISTQAANNVSISGGSITGITDLAVADGGTGASTAQNARINLLPSYTSNDGKVLGVNTGATDVEWITLNPGTVTSVNMSVPTGFSVSGNPITSSGTLAVAFSSGYSLPTNTSQTNWDTAYTDRLKWDGGATGLDASTGRTSLGLGTIATQAANNVSITGGSVTGIADITIADGGTGASDAATARVNLGLGSISTQESSNVSITGGSITGITDLAVADGGTGASNASSARINLLPSYTGNGGKVLAVNTNTTDVEWVAQSGGGGASLDDVIALSIALG